MKEQQGQLEKMIGFAKTVRYEDLDRETVEQLKRHLLDSIASLIFSLDQETPMKLRHQVADVQGSSGLIPLSKLTMDRAAELYTALIRYPDFMDNFLGKHATCHPSDNIGALLAAGHHQKISGKDFLKAMAVAYQLQCRLTEAFPVMSKGFDHTTLLNFSITIPLGEIFGLSAEQIRNACATAACTVNALVTCRSSYTSEWKGFVSSCSAFNCINKVLIAKRGMTGPYDIFGGPMALNKIMEMEMEHDWSEENNFSLIKKTILKSFNAEVHSQSLIEGMIELVAKNSIDAAEIEKISVDTFLTCYHIIGGGEYGDRKKVFSKEQADHSLPYLLAVAAIDGEVYPEQFLPGRIKNEDVQQLLQKVEVSTKFPVKEPRKLVSHLDPYTKEYPDKLMGEIVVTTSNGKKAEIKKEDYHGFFTRPLSWSEIEKKFSRLTSHLVSSSDQDRLIGLIGDLEKGKLSELVELLNELDPKAK